MWWQQLLIQLIPGILGLLGGIFHSGQAQAATQAKADLLAAKGDQK